jgi:hypothetical protein
MPTSPAISGLRHSQAAGLGWQLRTVAFAGNDRLYAQHRWNDYSAIDLVAPCGPPQLWDAARNLRRS